MELLLETPFPVPAEGLMPEYLMRCLQQAAQTHAARLGLSREVLLAQGNCVWMLVRSHFVLETLPHAGGTFCVQTWPSGADSVQSYRGFSLWENGRQIGSASQSWVLVDMEKRSILPTKQFPQLIELVNAQMPPAKRLRHLRFPALQEVERVVIGQEDMDINLHMNNARYLRYVMRCLPGKTALEVRIDYERECVCGDEITLLAAQQEGNRYVEGRNAAGYTAFRAVVRL